MPAYMTESLSEVIEVKANCWVQNVISHQLTATPPRSLPQMGTGIEADAVGISILASGILPLPLPDRVTLIPVMDWVWHRHFCSLRYRTDRMPNSLACCWCHTWYVMLIINHNKLPECPGKGKSGIANFSPASAFWHQGSQVPLVTD
jgi:hypothetical protein